MPNRSDNFNRADNASAVGVASDGLSGWVAAFGTWGIASNALYNSNAASNAVLTLESTDVTAGSVQVTQTVVGNFGGLVARYTDGNNYFNLRSNSGGGWVFQRRQGGSWTSLGTRTGTNAAGDVLRIEFSGSTVRAFVNGVQVGSDDTSGLNATATRHGVYASGDSTSRFDDFSITATGSGASITGSITLDEVDPTGTLGLNPSTLTGSITLDAVAPTGTLGIAPGSVTTFPFSRNTGSRPTGLTGIAVAILSDDANMTRLAGAASLSQDGAGRIIYSGAGLPAFGTSVLVVTREPDGKLGLERYTVQ